ncbi:hypothetical protein TWF106_001308 [Orbilia oligospora]|uniref:Sodium/calcium exchanger membrane region domain-containing protein n=2 Tax=Orbilia oligospora TaxID=2813651 RepID=A0A7C8USD4_ORBOL|nr:hypothetical protein TWF106_001308 [Orbilia oligospora]
MSKGRGINVDVTEPEKAWRPGSRDDGDVSPTGGEFPRDGEETVGFWRVSTKTADDNHAERIAEGIPNPFRFHPIKMLTITAKSTSRLSSYTHILLPAIPAGIVMWYTSRAKSPMLVFIFNFIAMIPSGNLLAFGSGELQHRLPKVWGASLEIFTGAIVEIIICLILLVDKQFDVVRAALLGSMFANLLLISGACFLAGGIAWKEQKIAPYVIEVSSAALLVSAVGTVAPSLFFQTIHYRKDVNEHRAEMRVLRLHTHSSSFHHVLERAESVYIGRKQYRQKLSVLESIFISTIGLVCVSFCAYFLVREIPGIVEEKEVSELFMGLILVPLIEKTSEHLTALNQAWDNQIDLAIYHCLGSTIQTALLVTPLIVMVGWAMNLDMDLNFQLFVALSLLFAILVVGNFMRDGKTHWLKGIFLLMIYYVLAVAAFNDPNEKKEAWGKSVREGVEAAHAAHAAAANEERRRLFKFL